MQRGSLNAVSITAVVLLILGSLTNVVGYQVAQSSNLKTINAEDDQKELLFQTILDITNNKEIQNIIQKSGNRGGLKRFLQVQGVILFLMKSKIRFSVFSPSPSIFTKSYLEYAYSMGVRLSRTCDASKIHSILEHFRVNGQKLQKELAAVIEKNDELNKRLEQLTSLQCDCEKDNTTGWNFPVLCTLLFPLFILALVLYFWFDVVLFGEIIGIIGLALNCFWTHL